MTGLLLALCAIVVAAAPGGPLPAIDTALAEGRSADAERIARRWIADEPANADAHGALARVLERQDRVDEALSILLQVGQGLVQSGGVDAGVEFLQRAVALRPDAAAAHAALGHALLLRRAHVRALEHLQRAESLGESSLALQLYLASALWETGQTEQAESVYRRALRASPEALPVLQALGGFLVWSGRHDEALPLLRRALAGDPGSLQTRLDLARAMERAGPPDAATAAFEELLRRAPDLSEAHYALARLYGRQGRSDEATQALQTFRRLHQQAQERTHRIQRERATLDAGWEMLRRGDHPGALRHFASLTPSVESLRGLSAAHAAAGDVAAAVDALERAVALAPDRSDLRLELARRRLAAATP